MYLHFNTLVYGPEIAMRRRTRPRAFAFIMIIIYHDMGLDCRKNSKRRRKRLKKTRRQPYTTSVLMSWRLSKSRGCSSGEGDTWKGKGGDEGGGGKPQAASDSRCSVGSNAPFPVAVRQSNNYSPTASCDRLLILTCDGPIWQKGKGKKSIPGVHGCVEDSEP